MIELAVFSVAIFGSALTFASLRACVNDVRLILLRRKISRSILRAR